MRQATGRVDLLTGKVEYQLFCHKLPSPPEGIFFGDDYCVQFSADGTGSVDFAGGYDEAPMLVLSDYQRSDSIVDFRWGGLVDESGSYQSNSSYGGIPIYWQKTAQETSVDAQFPILYWNPAGDTLSDRYSDISRTLPETATTAGCIFLESTCITTRQEKRCWSEGVLDGDYEHYDYLGRIDQKGSYEAGVKSGAWTSFSYRDSETTAYAHSDTIYDTQDPMSYGFREYEGDVLTEEGRYTRSAESSGFVMDGEWKFYHGPDDGSNAPGVLHRIEKYDHGEPTGIWTSYLVLYDTDRPTTGYTAVQAWKQTRVALDKCVRSTMDHATKLRVTTDRGTSICVVDDTCNDPVLYIEYSQQQASGSTQTTCETPDGAPRACPGVTCQ